MRDVVPFDSRSRIAPCDQCIDALLKRIHEFWDSGASISSLA